MEAEIIKRYIRIVRTSFPKPWPNVVYGGMDKMEPITTHGLSLIRDTINKRTIHPLGGVRVGIENDLFRDFQINLNDFV